MVVRAYILNNLTHWPPPGGFHKFDTSKVTYLRIFFISFGTWYHAIIFIPRPWYQYGLKYSCSSLHIDFNHALYTYQHLESFVCKTTNPQSCFELIRNITILNQISTQICKDSLDLKYPSKIYIWLLLQFWYPQVDSLISLWILIIDTRH